jgi:hypothetical protein
MFHASESKKRKPPETSVLEKESKAILVDDNHAQDFELPFADLISKTIDTPAQVDVLDLLLILFSSFLVAVGTIDSGVINA